MRQKQIKTDKRDRNRYKKIKTDKKIERDGNS